MFGFNINWGKVLLVIGIIMIACAIVAGIIHVYHNIQTSDNEGVVAVVEQKHSKAQDAAVNENLTIRKHQDEINTRRTSVDYTRKRVQQRTY